jgi:hypothetical protein
MPPSRPQEGRADSGAAGHAPAVSVDGRVRAGRCCGFAVVRAGASSAAPAHRSASPRALEPAFRVRPVPARKAPAARDAAGELESVEDALCHGAMIAKPGARIFRRRAQMCDSRVDRMSGAWEVQTVARRANVA